MSRRFLFAAASVLTAISMTGCSAEKEASIEPPDAWQAHLQPANVASSFKALRHEEVYVPIYSHIYDEDSSHVILLTGTLSLRNPDPANGVIIKSIAYFSTTGERLKELCAKPVVLGPMSTAEIVVPRTNKQGGSGASFVIEWMSEKETPGLIAEAVMISLGSSQNISFVSRGITVKQVDQSKQVSTRAVHP